MSHNNLDIVLNILETEDGIIPLTLGCNMDHHLLVTGEPRSGKSVLLKKMITSLCNSYSRDELELHLIDVKGHELKSYDEVSLFSRLPHVKQCVTLIREVQYTSMFRQLSEMCTERATLLRNAGLHDVDSYNREMRMSGQPELCLPRVFQIVTGFDKTNYLTEENLAVLKEDLLTILKVGGHVGIHLGIFTEDILTILEPDMMAQFTLRMVLRCDERLSVHFLGSHYASTINNGSGFVYVKSIDAEKYLLGKVLNISDKEFRETVLAIRKRCL